MPSRKQPEDSANHWPALFAAGFFRIAALLPWPAQKLLAGILGYTLFYLARPRRRIVDINLRLCFPQMNRAQRKAMTRAVFYNNALGVIETADGYYYSPEKLRKLVTINGLDKLQAAQQQGRGVLLLGAHFSHLDLGGALIAQFIAINCIYRPHNNPAMDVFIKNNRMKFLAGLIDRRDMRGILRALKKGEIIWYPPDQDYGGRHAVFVPFFGVNSATITATSRLARLNNSPVLTISYRRESGRQHYQLDIEELDTPFPTGDDSKDAIIVNKALEKMILRAPEQYMWTHRRFKTQPDAKGDWYKKGGFPDRREREK